MSEVDRRGSGWFSHRSCACSQAYCMAIKIAAQALHSPPTAFSFGSVTGRSMQLQERVNYPPKSVERRRPIFHEAASKPQNVFRLHSEFMG